MSTGLSIGCGSEEPEKARMKDPSRDMVAHGRGISIGEPRSRMLISSAAPGAQPTILEQAQAIASQTVEQVTALANQAANSQAAHNAVEQAKNLSNQAVAAASSAASTVAATATSLAGQAQAQAHDLAPSVIPAPGTGSTSAAGVDKSSDLKPHSEKDQAKLEKLFSDRPDPKKLQEQGILYGMFDQVWDVTFG